MKKLLSLALTLILSLIALFSVGCSESKGGVSLKYYGAAQDIVPLMIAGKETIGLIPEPAVTNLEKAFEKQGKAIYKLDLQELYDKEAKAYPQAVLMVKKSVLTENLYGELKASITESVAWAKENIATAVSATQSATLNANTLTASAIDGCKIYFEDASNSKDSVVKYINDIRSIEEKSANIVEEDFFYSTASGTNTKESYTFSCPDGAPALAISKLINDANQLGTGKAVNYKVVAANLITTEMSEGSSDIIIMPINAATKLYNKHDADDPYVCAAVITHGNFYIMSSEEITVEQLTDKQIAVPNKGAVPDWTIQLVLKNLGYTINVVE